MPCSHQLNALLHNPSEPPADEIEVTDPTHPLFGRRFAILEIQQPRGRPGHVLVSYQDGLRLRIPIQATSLVLDKPAQLRTQFTPRAIRDLLALVKECASPCPVPPNASGTDSPKT
jgi:hypothetical protein